MPGDTLLHPQPLLLLAAHVHAHRISKHKHPVPLRLQPAPCVQDMFYNMLPRRRAFKPGPEEHNLLQDVLQKYAIYKAGSVGFTLKRQVRAAAVAVHRGSAAAGAQVLQYVTVTGCCSSWFREAEQPIREPEAHGCAASYPASS